MIINGYKAKVTKGQILLKRRGVLYVRVFIHQINMTEKEKTLLQELIPQFAGEINCKIATNCITQWDIRDDHAKYSIAWQQQCGPVTDGEYQLGDEGHGSTFVCEQKSGAAGQTCCWPLGYDHAETYVKCMD